MSEVEPVEETPPSPEEVEARKHGWKDLDSWVADGGDPEKHRTPEAFNEFARQYEETKALKRETGELRAQQKQFAQTLAQEQKRIREQTLKEVETRHDKAVEEGDVEGAKKALQDAQELSTPTQENPFEAWRTRPDNAWYNEDPDLFAYANEMDRFLHMRSGGGEIPDVSAHMDQVKEMVKQKYPGKFGMTNPNRDTAPTTDVPREVLSKSSKPKHTWDDLEDWQKDIGGKFVSQGLMTRQDYVDGLVETGELQ